MFWHTNGTRPAHTERLRVHVVDVNVRINIASRLSRNKKKVYYTASWGKDAGQCIATGIFTFTDPINSIQRKHDKDAPITLENALPQ